MQFFFKLKQLFSYLVDIPIERTKSTFNPELNVFLSKGRFKLVSKNAIYSYADLYDNYYKAFEEINFNTISPSSILVLGLGLGSIPFMLEKKFNINASYTCIEIDPEIIRLFNKYIRMSLKSKLDIINDNATSFLKNHNKSYDIICMDIFEDAHIPIEFETLEFIKQIKNLLSTKGILIYNRLAENKNDLIYNLDFDSKFITIFPNRYIVKMDSNWMYISN
jgi:predicted RNA methylase